MPLVEDDDVVQTLAADRPDDAFDVGIVSGLSPLAWRPRGVLAAHRRRRDARPMTRLHEWAATIHDRRGHNKATIAVANKLGRIVWAVWHKDVPFAGSQLLEPAHL